jgi:hypothetical protein
MAQRDRDTIQQIESAAQGPGMIPASRVKSWLGRAPSVEVLGAIRHHIVRQSRRVEPPLSMEDICSIVQEYYRQCLIQDRQDSDYVQNRSVAGIELVDWFRSLWRDDAVPREYLVRLKAMLFDLCIDPKIPQEAMVGAVIEHLFEMPEVAEFFADWKDDSRLSEAYDRAMDWAKDHHGPDMTLT